MENTEPSPDTKGTGLPFPTRDLAQLWRIPFPGKASPEDVERALRERIKELNCLYGVSQLAERHLGLLSTWGTPGRIFQDLGLKGLRRGQALVSSQHANFFLNQGGATARDVLELIDVVRRRVHAATGQWMQCEVIYVSPQGGMAPAHEALAGQDSPASLP